MASHELASLSTPGHLLPRMSFAHRDAYDASKVKPVENVHWEKPAGGLWLSPALSLTTSAWTEWKRQNLFYADESMFVYEARLKPTARFLTIDGREAMQRIVSRYWHARNDEKLMAGELYLDYEAMAQEWDGLYVTEGGIDANVFAKPSLATWDFASVIVFSPSAVEMMKPLATAAASLPA